MTLNHDQLPALTVQNLVAGRYVGGGTPTEFFSPYDGVKVGGVELATPEITHEAVTGAASAAKIMKKMPPRERAKFLKKASEILTDRAESIAKTMCLETGKALRDTRVELARAADVVSFCADEAIRIEGRHISLEGSAVGQGKLAIALPVPIGVVLGIVPFNAPVNLACHKIAPALAAGNSIIIKAPPQAPKTLDMLARIFLDAGTPPEALSVIHGDADVGDALVEDPRVNYLSFTGSHKVGLEIKKKAGTRGCLLELGGLGPVIVHKDADLEKAAKMCCSAGFRLAGQSCASVQNLFVHNDVWDSFKERFLAHVTQLKLGDPMDPETDLGPVIDDRAAERIEASISGAVSTGAQVLLGGRRDGRMIEPTVIMDATPDMDIIKNEIFGPVVVLRRFDDLDDPINWIGETGQGINCGVFTDSNQVALKAAVEISCAAVIINGTCTFRPEQFPYGGTGKSGYGRESPRDSILAMTQERILVFA